MEQFKHLRTPGYILSSLSDLKKKKYGEYGTRNRLREIKFVEYSLMYAKEEGVFCHRVDFDWWDEPLLYNLNQDQLNWYFYWRASFLKEQFLETNVENIIIFVQELVNYSFNKNVAFNASMLVRLLHIYGAEYGIEKLLMSTIDEMLLEIDDPRAQRMYYGQLPELYTALESYEASQKNEKPEKLSKISISCWKAYVSNHRKTKFFKENRNKVYKTFKECLFLLEETYVKNNMTFLSAYFDVKIEKRKKKLYNGLAAYRKDPQQLMKRVDLKVVYETDKLYQEIGSYFRLAENVTRLLQGEKRQLKIEHALPEGLKENMLDYMQKPKKRVLRAKKVKEEVLEEGSQIPQKVEVEFNNERIKQLQVETDSLIEEVNRRADLDEQEVFVKEAPVNKSEEEKVSGLDYFFAKTTDEIDEEQVAEYINKLDSVEIDFLQKFSQLTLAKDEAIQYLKQKSRMVGSTVAAINEKAQEIWEDNLLEEESDQFMIIEEFEVIINRLKEIG